MSDFLRLTMTVSLLLGIHSGCERATTTPASTPAQSSPSTNANQPQSLPTVNMVLGNRTFTIEVAPDEPTRQKGMMFRDSNPANHGMIFAFAKEEPLQFWMKNTRIPLDIVYLDSRGKIVQIRSMQPLDLTGIDSIYPAKYAIELSQGAAAAAGLKVGDLIQVPPEVTAAAR